MRTLRIQEDVFVFGEALPVPGLGFVPVNAGLIRGPEPLLVDTSAPIWREDFFNAVFEQVDPEDVRWIFLTHDDRDHSGNLVEALRRCPNARLITTFMGVGRMSDEWQLPLDRVHLLNDGDRLMIGGREMAAVQPPLFDGPGSRGLWDPHSRVFFSADAFGACVPALLDEAPESEDYYQGFDWFNRANHPWFSLLPAASLAGEVAKIAALEARVIVSSHGLVNHQTARACERLAALPALPPVALPDQAALMAMLSGG